MNQPDFSVAGKVWGGRIPARVKMLKTVTSDFPLIKPVIIAQQGREYEVASNPLGAISVYLEDGKQLGVKPDEFEVVEWW